MAVWWQALRGVAGSASSEDGEGSTGSSSGSTSSAEESGPEPGAAGFAAPSRARQALERAREQYKKGYAEYPDPDGKEGQMKYGCVDGEPPDCAFIERLKWDLANSYYWSGHFCQDYVFFVAQWHPALGILLAHPNHPWSKKDRLLMMTLSLALNAMPAAWLAERNSHDSLLWDKTSIFFFITIPDIIFGAIMYQATVAETRCKWCPFCRPCMQGLKRCLFCLVAAAVVLSAILSRLLLGNLSWREAVGPLARGKAYSFALWFPTWALLPCRLGFLDLWSAERRAERRRRAQEGA